MPSYISHVYYYLDVSIQSSQHIQGETQEAALALPPGLKPSVPRGQIGVAFLSFFLLCIFSEGQNLGRTANTFSFELDIVFGQWNTFDKSDIHPNAPFVESFFSSHLCVETPSVTSSMIYKTKNKYKS